MSKSHKSVATGFIKPFNMPVVRKWWPWQCNIAVTFHFKKCMSVCAVFFGEMLLQGPLLHNQPRTKNNTPKEKPFTFSKSVPCFVEMNPTERVKWFLWLDSFTHTCDNILQTSCTAEGPLHITKWNVWKLIKPMGNQTAKSLMPCFSRDVDLKWGVSLSLTDCLICGDVISGPSPASIKCWPIEANKHKDKSHLCLA